MYKSGLTGFRVDDAQAVRCLQRAEVGPLTRHRGWGSLWMGGTRCAVASLLLVLLVGPVLPALAWSATLPHVPTPPIHQPPVTHVHKPPAPPDYCKAFRTAGVGAQGHHRWSRPPRVVVSIHRSYSAILTTTKGAITISLAASSAPITVNNFLFLSCNGFYNGTIFHRVSAGTLIQGGDPTGTGTGGPGYLFKDESVHGAYVRGVVAMGNYGPDTNGSQFFVLLGPIVLPPNYTIFGKVVTGLAVADAIANVPTTEQSDAAERTRPIHPDHILSVRVTSP